MVTRFGMSDRLGHLTYGTQHNTQFLHSNFATEDRNHSEKTSEAIDDEVRRLGDELYERAKTILTSRKADLERIAEELIQKETLIVINRSRRLPRDRIRLWHSGLRRTLNEEPNEW